MSKNPFDIVRDFEQSLADICGSKYAVAVDSCSSALFLCCKFLKVDVVTIPCRTHYSVPCSIINAGGKVKFQDIGWKGIYKLDPYPIYDAACRFREKMYISSSLMCLSFDSKKNFFLGKGGAILLDDERALKWFRVAIFNGREELPMGIGNPLMVGWNMYMEPEKAARGLSLLWARNLNCEDLEFDYPDLSKYEVYNNNS